MPRRVETFTANHVDTDEYLIHLARYVHLNPVAAGLSRHPGEWPFSNYLEWIEERNGALVDHDWIRYYFPSPTSYIQFVNSKLSAKMEEQLKPYLLE